jgi:hypothetical protein
MQQNVLPGKQEPYFLGSGEGQRYLLGPFLATIIGRRQDTGSLMEGVVLIGAKNSVMPCAEPPDWKQPLPGVDVEFLFDESSAMTRGAKCSVAPPGVEPYVIPAGDW